MLKSLLRHGYRSPLFRTIGTSLILLGLVSGSVVCQAQNLGASPAVGKAVLGQNAYQVEGSFMNMVNWISNVICPVGAALAVVATVLAWRTGRGYLPWALTAGGLLGVSMLVRLAEYFIAQGQAIG